MARWRLFACAKIIKKIRAAHTKFKVAYFFRKKIAFFAPPSPLYVNKFENKVFWQLIILFQVKFYFNSHYFLIIKMRRRHFFSYSFTVPFDLSWSLVPKSILQAIFFVKLFSICQAVLLNLNTRLRFIYY